jgi:hypothetical protein
MTSLASRPVVAVGGAAQLRAAQHSCRDVEDVGCRPGRVCSHRRVAVSSTPDVLGGSTGLAGGMSEDRVAFRRSEPERPGTFRSVPGQVPAAPQPGQGQAGSQPPAAVPGLALKRDYRVGEEQNCLSPGIALLKGITNRRDADETVGLSKREDDVLDVVVQDPVGEIVVYRDHLQGALVMASDCPQEVVDVADAFLVEAFVASVGGEAVEDQQAWHGQVPIDRHGVMSEGVGDVDEGLQSLTGQLVEGPARYLGQVGRAVDLDGQFLPEVRDVQLLQVPKKALLKSADIVLGVNLGEFAAVDLSGEFIALRLKHLTALELLLVALEQSEVFA